jgi:hypothetical protein
MRKKLTEFIVTIIFLYKIKTKNLFIFLYLYFKFKRFIPDRLNQKYLEIAIFEGSSLVYFSRILKNSSFTCVDIWKGQEELNECDFEIIEKNFHYNSSDISKDKIIINKNSSRNFFIEKNNKFSIIYIDGNHSYKEVLNDLNESFRILLNGGILSLDDYTWSWYSDPKNNPGYAINVFLNENYNKLKFYV